MGSSCLKIGQVAFCISVLLLHIFVILSFLFMYLSVGHHHKADPTGLQSRVKNDLRLMI